ncbi:MAG: ATP-binding protein [Candidatus Berkiellales bacterium]
MRRLVDYHLNNWVKQRNPKPLILRGARQVGKTRSVRYLASAFSNFVEINFELDNRAKDIFEIDLEPERILTALSLLAGKSIIPGETLLFLDEIQVAPRAIMALRYFYEKIPNLHVIAAGSLIDFALESISVPVGRVTFLYMYPMSFMEFLAAIKQNLLIEAIMSHSVHEQLSEPIHQKLLEYLGVYMIVGGMPEVVNAWVETKDIIECLKIQQSLADTFKIDFEKYSKKFQLKYLDLLFKQVPRYLGNVVKYSNFSKEHRKRELEPCLELLEKANIIHKVLYSSANGFPLGAEANFEKFKLIFLDIAISQAVIGLDYKEWILKGAQEFVNKGAMAEALIGQEILAYSNPLTETALYYWQRESRNSSAEVDYIFQLDQFIIPIEVKSGFGSSLNSLKAFLQSHPNTPYGIRFSIYNYSIFDHIHSYPLYAVASVCAKDKTAIEKLIQ